MPKVITKEDILNTVNKLRPLPHAMVQLSQLINSKDSSVKQIEEVIKTEPVLVSKILRLVNSSYFSSSKKVNEISKAIVYLGLKNIRNIIAIDSLKDFYQKHSFGLYSQNLWVHSITVAIIAQLISQRIHSRHGEDIFLAGILHDMGIIIGNYLFPKIYEEELRKFTHGQRLLPVYEFEKFGINHIELILPIIEEWEMDKEIIDAISNHHSVSGNFEPDSSSGILLISHFISDNFNNPIDELKNYVLPDSLCDHLKNRAIDYKVLIDSIPAELKKASFIGANE